jgi:uncharacterized protein (TIGR02145 family)
MSFFNFGKLGLTLMLSAVLVAGSVCVSGCGGGNKDASSGKSEQGAVSGKSGKLTDSRDGQKYETVKIGNQVWMAQNLNYQTGSSWCYGGDNSNCEKYGRLYDWETAKTACPKGWHLPSREEWAALVAAAGGDAAGKALKSASGWENNGNGTDSYGFSALPGGSRFSDVDFNYAGYNGSWWTAAGYDPGKAYYRFLYYDNDGVDERDDDESYGNSVRCLEDN